MDQSLIRAMSAAAVLAALGACLGRGPATPMPSPTPSPSPLPFMGSYSLAIDASSVCRLDVERYQWGLEATTSGTGVGTSVRATLPGGDDDVDVALQYTSVTAISGRISTRTVGFGNKDLRVTISGAARGTSTRFADGRGQILDGVLNGAIALSKKGDPRVDSEGSCTAADHKWTLIPEPSASPSPSDR